MKIAQGAFSFYIDIPVIWGADWAWGLPLIILTVVVHVFGLARISQRAVQAFSHMTTRYPPTAVFAVVMGTTTLLATCLHAFEAGIWAFSYQFLGARPGYKSAMLYSLSALTSYGHAGVFLEGRWQLLGAIEALNGSLLFGLTTAFLFGMIQKVWLLDTRDRH